MGLIRHDAHDAFFSYAHDDNLDGDIMSLCKEFAKHAAVALKDEQERLGRTLDVFIDKLGLPANGNVSTELMQRVAASKFLFICVGPRYAASKWCLDELNEFLRALNGDLDEAAKRIFVVVLEADGWQLLAAKAHEKLGSGLHGGFEPLLGQIRTDLYDEHGALKPYLPVRDSADAVPNARYASVRKRLVDTFALRSRAMLSAARHSPPPGVPPGAAPAARVPAPRPQRVLVGVVTPDLEDDRRQLIAALHAQDIATDALEPTDLTRQDSMQAIRQRAGACGAVVMPYSNAPVLLAVLAGGHLAVQESAVGDAAPILWWRPATDAMNAAHDPAAGHEKFFARLDTRARSGAPAEFAAHVKGLLAPPDAVDGQAVRVYIESSAPHTSDWERIGERIRSHWPALAGSNGRPPAIDCAALPFIGTHNLGEGALKESHLIIVLWGEGKAFESLDAQVRLLAKELSRLGANAEVSVVPLIPPRPEDIASVDVIRFSVPFRREDGGALREIDGARLRELLRRALERATNDPDTRRAA